MIFQLTSLVYQRPVDPLCDSIFWWAITRFCGQIPAWGMPRWVYINTPKQTSETWWLSCRPIVGADYFTFRGQRKHVIAHLAPPGCQWYPCRLLHKLRSTMKHHQSVIQMKLIKPLDYVLTKHDSTTINQPIQAILDHVLSNHYSAAKKPPNKPPNKPTNMNHKLAIGRHCPTIPKAINEPFSTIDQPCK